MLLLINKLSGSESDAKSKTRRNFFWKTSGIAGIIATLDIIFLLAGKSSVWDISYSIAVIGITTFFGMLIISSYHAAHKKDHEKPSQTTTPPPPTNPNENKKEPKPKPGAGAQESTQAKPQPSGDSDAVMRKALASTLIIVYIVVFSLVTFDEEFQNLEISTTTTITNQTGTIETTNQTVSSETMLSHFTNIIMVVIASYFGARVIEKAVKAKQSSSSK